MVETSTPGPSAVAQAPPREACITAGHVPPVFASMGHTLVSSPDVPQWFTST